ncbi:MAG: hypothetical protein GY705_12495 [Bacteroidetes bacterium]|nr:hypothetical protein [Bacteroidota bacterium]
MEVLVVGNSFVRRFGDVDLLGLDSNRHRIHMVGRWRGTNLNLISDINYFIEDILESFRKVDHLILVSGHNDLAEEVFISEYALAQDLILVGRRAIEAGVQRVTFTEVIPRFGENGFRRTPHFLYQQNLFSIQEAEIEYHRRKNVFNICLQYFIDITCRFDYMEMEGLRVDVWEKLENDGIHLNLDGWVKFQEALRKAIIVNGYRLQTPGKAPKRKSNGAVDYRKRFVMRFVMKHRR